MATQFASKKELSLLEDHVFRLEEKMLRLQEQVEERLRETGELSATRFDQTFQWLEKLEQERLVTHHQLETVEQKINQHEQRLGQHSKQSNLLGIKLMRMDLRLDKIELMLRKVKNMIAKLQRKSSAA